MPYDGTYTLTIDGLTTEPIPHDATQQEIDAAIARMQRDAHIKEGVGPKARATTPHTLE